MPSLNKLRWVFVEARRLLSNPENDFTWSSWHDQETALREIDGVIVQLKDGALPSESMLQLLFAPTGPIQEVSLSSGWGEGFIQLAEAFDDAISESCGCFDSPDLFAAPGIELGMDRHFAEVSTLTCRACGQIWLRYRYENEGFSGSGRWFMGAVEGMADLTAANAKETLERLPWYVWGGSYFGGKTGWGTGTILL